MSLLLSHSLADATAILRGERYVAADSRSQGFSLDGLATWRLTGLTAAPGHADLDSDMAWQAVVRSWWGLGLTWGLCLTAESGEIRWNLVLPTAIPAALDTVASHLTGAELEPTGQFPLLGDRLRRLPFRAMLAGHSGMGADARPEPAVRSMLDSEFMLIILAQAMPREEIDAETHRLAQEEQFVRDEHLSRQGLERDSHSGANRFLSLIAGSRERAEAAMREGGWSVQTVLAAATEDRFRQGQSLLQGAFAADGGMPESLRWQNTSDPRKRTFLRTAEAAALTRPPRREMPGFALETRIRESVTGSTGSQPVIFAIAASSVAGVPAVAPGRILDDHGKPGAWLEIPVADLCRHLLIAGMTGSGKSVTCEHLLLELWREHQIPWLVIDPGMKPGYRRLLNSEIAADLEVWAIGDPKSRRLPLNPLAVPPGIGLAEHTSALFSVIASAFELVAPMPEVLATAIERTYRNHGWDLAGLVPDQAPPRLADLIREIDQCSSELGYGAEITGNIRAGLLLRLSRLLGGPLAPELGSPKSIDIAALTARPTIIELSGLPDASTQALVMGFLTLQLRHHWRLAGQSDSLLHVLVIEEAHRLLKAVPETSANSSRNRATEDLANMLAELRGFGVGLVIVDQTPAALVPSAIANTGTKILHRLDHPTDRELAGRAAGLPADQVDLLGSLKPGDVILRSDRRPKPYRLCVPNPSITYGKLPVPGLPQVPLKPTPVAHSGKCPVCGDLGCRPRATAADQNFLRRRLTALQAVFLQGEAASWEWSRRELLSREGETQLSASAPLCFLVALGEAARFDSGKIERLRRAFESRTKPPQP
jgi:hypothetical protein